VEQSFLLLCAQILCLSPPLPFHSAPRGLSEASLCVSSSAGAETRLSTSMVERRSGAAWLRPSSARSY